MSLPESHQKEGRTGMKIRIVETEIEADAKELRESRTLSDNFTMLLSRCFMPRYEPDDDEEHDEGEGGQE